MSMPNLAYPFELALYPPTGERIDAAAGADTLEGALEAALTITAEDGGCATVYCQEPCGAVVLALVACDGELRHTFEAAEQAHYRQRVDAWEGR